MYCIYRCFNTQNYIYPFQNLSLGFILKIFLKFRKFQPRYSYKIYSYKKKECSQSDMKLPPVASLLFTCTLLHYGHIIRPLFLHDCDIIESSLILTSLFLSPSLVQDHQRQVSLVKWEDFVKLGINMVDYLGRILYNPLLT